MSIYANTRFVAESSNSKFECFIFRRKKRRKNNNKKTFDNPECCSCSVRNHTFNTIREHVSFDRITNAGTCVYKYV